MIINTDIGEDLRTNLEISYFCLCIYHLTASLTALKHYAINLKIGQSYSTISRPLQTSANVISGYIKFRI